MSSRERFLAACGCRPLDRPPVWVMRQAGRYLPEYRALKEKHTFVEMVRTPDLATEVTLQPLRRFDLDAAILFSDILVVPEALGLPYHFRDGGGIAMERRLETPQDIAALRPASAVREHLAYVPAALRQIRGEIGDRKALLGFAGSPWTLACYMIDGGSSDDFARAKALFHADRPAFDALMERLTEATIQHLLAQIEAGADAVQIFDSWAGIIPGVDYEAASLAWIRAIDSAIGDRAPVIVFARGAAPSLGPLTTTGASVLGLDWTIDLAAAAAVLPAHVAVQGNLDPVLLNTSPEIVTREATRLLEGMRGRPGHIFNLGHGIMPQARLECMAALVETVISFS
ncbi:MAG: uroporphyrinogen decarboxylase [Verrucomicrobia bacterium]|nr:MAG: uroporphyrinogen decarboxylase [Verrucomicrobiota bacterium]